MRFFLIVSKSSFSSNVVLQVKGWTIPKMIRLAKNKWDILDYLPEHKDCKLSNRGFLWNVVNTFISDEFEYFIKEKFVNREKKMNYKRKLEVTILSEFIKIFNNINFSY